MFNLFGPSVKSVDANQFHELMSDGYTVIDVRTKEEFGYGHIKNAKLIDIYKSDFGDKINELDKNGKYLVYCQSGSRSKQAVAFMNKSGIDDAINLTGGIMTWHRAGKPLVK